MLDSLDGAERDEVVAAAKSIQLKTHDILVQQGAPAVNFYLIEAGRLRLSQTSETGQETAARTAGPGQSFGGTLLMGRPRYLQSARAQQPTRLLAWTRSMLMALVDKYPVLKARIVDAELRPGSVPRARLEDHGEGTVAERLSHVLMLLAANGSRLDDQSIDIVHSLTRQDLADLTGADLREVSAQLSAWEEQGLAQLSRTHVRLLDPSRLEALAGA